MKCLISFYQNGINIEVHGSIRAPTLETLICALTLLNSSIQSNGVGRSIIVHSGVPVQSRFCIHNRARNILEGFDSKFVRLLPIPNYRTNSILVVLQQLV